MVLLSRTFIVFEVRIYESNYKHFRPKNALKNTSLASVMLNTMYHAVLLRITEFALADRTLSRFELGERLDIIEIAFTRTV